MPILIMTVGLPRSGKSGWAKRQYMPIVSPSAVKSAINQPDASNEVVLSHTLVMIRSLFAAGHHTVILDSNNTTKAERNQYQSYDWIQRYKLFDADMELCIDRAMINNRRDLIPIIRNVAAAYEPLTEDDKPICMKVCREDYS